MPNGRNGCIHKERKLFVAISLFFGKRYSFHINLFWRIPRVLECVCVEPGIQDSRNSSRAFHAYNPSFRI
jgi:hypothetical protein